MSNTISAPESLVISRGLRDEEWDEEWDEDLSPLQIQAAIDHFQAWHARLVAEGRMRAGQRLAREGRIVTRRRVTDGPLRETKKVIGGDGFILAGSLDDAAATAAQNPCLACGLSDEIRPIETAGANAFALSSETPQDSTRRGTP
jgi:hypothetical protein